VRSISVPVHLKLLNSVDGKSVTNPLEGMKTLSSEHPYSKIGSDVESLISEFYAILKEIGIKASGDASKLHYRLTPLGEVKPAWLTLDEFMTLPTADKLPYNKVVIFNLAGFLDFYPQFLAAGLSKLGVKSQSYVLTAPLFERLRKSTTEMRGPNIARVIDRETLDVLANEINRKSADAEVVLMPAIVGMCDTKDVEYLRSRVKLPLYFISTVPISVPGLRMQQQFKDYFTRLGGVYMLGDSVNGGSIENSELKYVTTVNHEDERFYADNFVIATGSFISRGLVSTFDRVYEPLFNLDVVYDENRPSWSEKNIYEHQKFMNYGLSTDDKFRVRRNGEALTNLYASGSILANQNPMENGCGAGVAILSALKVASTIIS